MNEQRSENGWPTWATNQWLRRNRKFHLPGLTLRVLVGCGLAYLLVGIYITSGVISRNHRAPYDWAAGSYVVEMN